MSHEPPRTTRTASPEEPDSFYSLQLLAPTADLPTDVADLTDRMGELPVPQQALLGGKAQMDAEQGRMLVGFDQALPGVETGEREGERFQQCAGVSQDRSGNFTVRRLGVDSVQEPAMQVIGVDEERRFLPV